MKKKDLQELRKKEIPELKNLAEEKRLEIERVRAEIVSGREKNLKKVKNLRRDLAQILTLIKEKEILEFEFKRET